MVNLLHSSREGQKGHKSYRLTIRDDSASAESLPYELFFVVQCKKLPLGWRSDVRINHTQLSRLVRILVVASNVIVSKSTFEDGQGVSVGSNYHHVAILVEGLGFRKHLAHPHKDIMDRL